jgi:hypothetical protein
MKYVVAMVVALLCFANAGHAQEAARETIPAAPVADSTAPAYGADLEALQRELAGVNAQHGTAMDVHIASAVFGVGGAGALASGLGMALSGINSSGESIVAFFLVIGGGSFSFINFVLTLVGASLDLGSASHRRKLLRAHPELSVEVTPGPGEAGLGFAVHF